MGDHLGVGLGRELVPVGSSEALQLAVVLDDAVEDDRDFDSSQPVSGCAFCSVTCPCVAQRVWPIPVDRLRAVVLGDLLEVGELADRLDVVEAVVLQQAMPAES